MTLEQGVEALVLTVNNYVLDHTPPRGSLPDGIRLEIHPSVRYMIMSTWIDSYTRFMTGQGMPFDPALPLKITTDIPKDSWRLVIVKEEVINGGVLPGVRV